jgi:glycosyltransferase involved in cell wall biosynthesis
MSDAPKIALCLPYYMNQGMLDEQLRRLAGLPAAILEQLELIVVDDGSPNGEAVANVRHVIGCPVRVFRIDVDIRWNQDAARNIGAQEAEARWLLLTDIDHVVPLATWEYLLAKKFEKARAYRFSRATLDEIGKKDRITPYKPHPNSWFMTRGLYEQVGGYDERFAGHYGTDAEFRDRLTRIAGDPILLPQLLYRVPRSTIADASTTTYQRKNAPEDIGAIPRIKAVRALNPDWVPLKFRNPYRQIFP